MLLIRRCNPPALLQKWLTVGGRGEEVLDNPAGLKKEHEWIGNSSFGIISFYLFKDSLDYTVLCLPLSLPDIPILQPPDQPGEPLIPGFTQAGVQCLGSGDEVEASVKKFGLSLGQWKWGVLFSPGEDGGVSVAVDEGDGGIVEAAGLVFELCWILTCIVSVWGGGAWK